MKKILIATPIYPPSSGGPATHAKKLEEFFGVRAKIFVFEKWNFLPFGLRHFFAFVEIFSKSIFQVKIIFALDGFSVAMPAILVGKILNIPVVLRIGGDLVHEQYVEGGDFVPMNVFYEKLNAGQIRLSKFLALKMFIQKWVVKNSQAIIFNTDWQCEMYKSTYNLPEKKYTLYNPSVKLPTSDVEKVLWEKENYTISCITRKVPFKNVEFVEEIIQEINQENLLDKEIFFDTKNDTRENVLQRIANSHAYISPGISDIAPNQLLEALSMGIPSICTKNTGYFEHLKNNSGILFVDPKNREEIKSAILKVLDRNINFSMRTELKKFHWPHTWEKYFLEYERIIKEFL